MTKIDIFSGFLGAGKTTLIKKLIEEVYKGEKLVLIENEFGEIGIDGGFLKDAGVEINEMNSGCICCSLVGDFGEALQKVLDEFSPDRILIEPSGVGKLSDVVRAVQGIGSHELEVNCLTTIVDPMKYKMYARNFGEFFNNQVENASTIVLSRTGNVPEDKIKACVDQLREHNADAVIVTTPWDQLGGKELLAAMENRDTLEAELRRLAEETEEEECECCHEHGHEHGHEHEHGHGHEHGHEHEHEHEHGHEGHHHADEVFVSWGIETVYKFTEEEIKTALNKLSDEDKYGIVLRAKGIVASSDGEWIHFDYVPGEIDIRRGPAGVTGRLCVIGSQLKQDAISELFC